MGKHYKPNKELQDLVNCFEDSLRQQADTFFPEEEFEQLIEYYESIPNYKKALLASKRAVNLFPFSGSFYIKLAQIYFQLNQYNEVWNALEQAKIYENTSSEILLLEADLLCVTEDYAEAIELLNQLFDYVNTDEKADVLLEIADVHEMASQSEELGKILQEILVHYPENEEAIHRFWSFTVDQHHYEQSTEFFKQLVDDRPYNFLAWYYLAKCYDEIGLLEQAIIAYEYCLAINDYYFAYWDYGFCLQELERWQDAIEHYTEMQEKFDEEVSVKMEIGICYREQKRYPASISEFFSAKSLSNDNHKRAECEFQIAKVFLLMEDYHSAKSHFNASVQLNPKKTRYWNHLGNLFMSLEQYSEALNCFVQSLAKNDIQAKQWINLATCYQMLDTKELAIDSLKRAIELLPNHVKLNYTYAAYLLHYGYHQSGLNALETALSLDSSKKKIIFALFPELKKNSEIMYLLDQF